jgi:hypothetical protein
MDMVIPNGALVFWLQWAFNNTTDPYEDFVIDLFSNNHTCAVTDTAGTYTTATFPGYAQVAIARSTFGSATATGGLGTIVSSVTPLWNCTGGSGQLVYGWFLRGATSGQLLACANFASARNMLPSTSESLGAYQQVMGQYP